MAYKPITTKRTRFVQIECVSLAVMHPCTHTHVARRHRSSLQIVTSQPRGRHALATRSISLARSPHGGTQHKGGRNRAKAQRNKPQKGGAPVAPIVEKGAGSTSRETTFDL